MSGLILFGVGGLLCQPGPLGLPACFYASRDTPLPLGGLCYALNGRLEPFRHQI